MNLIFGVDSISSPMTGIGVYSANLCKEFLAFEDLNITGLARFSLLDKESLRNLVATSLLGQESLDISAVAGNAFTRFLISKAKGSDLARYFYHKGAQIAAAKNLRGLQSDAIYHAPNFIGYGQSRIKVITVHDLSHLEFPEMHPESRVRFMNSWLESSIREAAHVIVDTEFIKHQLLQSGMLRPGAENKISTVHLGVSEDFVKDVGINEQECLDRYGLTRDSFVLSIGTLEPRKNYERLLNAYLQLPRDIAAEFPLVICGAFGWKYDRLMDMVSSVEAPYRVIITGHVPQSVMIGLMRNCRVFVYPSLYEGFGLPILEAMKCGVPVITSQFGSMAEVAGDAALLIDSHSEKIIADSLMQMLDSSTLRDKFVSLGLSHSKKFTWRECANQTFKIYQSF